SAEPEHERRAPRALAEPAPDRTYDWHGVPGSVPRQHAQQGQERPERRGAVRDALFLRQIDLGEGLTPGWNLEERVVTETTRSSRRRCDSSLDGGLDQQLFSGGIAQRQGTAIARRTLLGRKACELLEKEGVVAFVPAPRPASAVNPRSAGQGIDAQP